MRQVMPIAAGLAGGLAPSTFGAVSRTIGWGLGRGPMLALRGSAYAAGFIRARSGSTPRPELEPRT